jgi:hypothetical protein
MASLWRAGIEAEDFTFGDDRIAFKLPFDIGRFEGSLGERSLVGVVHTNTGDVVDLELHAADVIVQFALRIAVIRVSQSYYNY